MTRAAEDHPIAVLLVSRRHAATLVPGLTAAGLSVMIETQPGDVLGEDATAAADVVVIDLRGAFQAMLPVLTELTQRSSGREIAVVTLLETRHRASLGFICELGISHFLMSPFADADLVHTVLLAGRAATVARSRVPSRSRRRTPTPIVSVPTAEEPTWRMALADRTLVLSPQAAQLLTLRDGRPIPWDDYLEHVEVEQRAGLRAAVARLDQVGASATIRVGWQSARDAAVHSVVHRLSRVAGAAGQGDQLVAALSIERPVGEGAVGALDVMTGLPNEAAGVTWLAAHLESDARFDPVVATLLIGLHRFDRVNAAHGRAVADRLLRAVARRLKGALTDSVDGSIGGSHLLVRLSGAEFAILRGGPLQLKDLVFLAQRIANTFDRPFVIDNQIVHLACRIGIATLEAGTRDTDVLFRRAGAALAQARTQEPNSFAVFSAEDAEAPRQRATLEQDLRVAIASGALDLTFQPQIDAISNRMVGVEALVRWHHPTMGMIRPDMFIELAEMAEFLPLLGEDVLRRALAAGARWTGPAMGGLRLAVNVAPAQLRAPDFAEQVEMFLAESGFDPGRLTLEITESAVIDDVAHAAAVMDRLHAMGLQIAIDDFGTGQASYAYLKSLPFDYLKLDKAFVTGIATDRRDRAMAHAIIEMARTLGMAVIAEGVETPEQLAALRREGCSIYQGFLCAQPMVEADLVRFAEGWSAKPARTAKHA